MAETIEERVEALERRVAELERELRISRLLPPPDEGPRERDGTTWTAAGPMD